MPPTPGALLLKTLEPDFFESRLYTCQVNNAESTRAQFIRSWGRVRDDLYSDPPTLDILDYVEELDQKANKHPDETTSEEIARHLNRLQAVVCAVKRRVICRKEIPNLSDEDVEATLDAVKNMTKEWGMLTRGNRTFNEFPNEVAPLETLDQARNVDLDDEGTTEPSASTPLALPAVVWKEQLWTQETMFRQIQSNVGLKFLKELKKGRKNIARILYRQHWPNDDVRFNFLKLPTELRLPVYECHLPNENDPRRVRCLLDHRCAIVSSRVTMEGAKRFLSHDMDWDYDLEMLWPLLATCRTVRNEVGNLYFGQRRHQLNVTPKSVTWLGSENYFKWSGWTNKIKTLNISMWASEDTESLYFLKDQCKKLVTGLEKMESLRRLDLILFPHPFDHAGFKSVRPLFTTSIEEFLLPLQSISGLEKATFGWMDDVSGLPKIQTQPVLEEGTSYSNTLEWQRINERTVKWAKEYTEDFAIALQSNGPVVHTLHLT